MTMQGSIFVALLLTCTAAMSVNSVFGYQWRTQQNYRRRTPSPSSHHRKPFTAEHLRSRAYSYETPKNKRPNIILFVTDDQDVELGSLNFMSETIRLLREGGAEFRHAYATTPMCCPSRSSMLTGLYVHNHNVYTNNDNCSSIQWQTEYETRSFATYLQDSGYHTGYYGKYLNKYNGSYVPPGWQEWGGLIMNSKYYNYSVNVNGKKIRHGDDYYEDYYTDLVANDSVNFLRQWKMRNSDKPVLLVVSFPAPHGPEDSAPQYSNMFMNVTTHHTTSYDYAPNPDKQWILQVTGPMLPIHKQFTNMLMTKRLQTLQSVDSAVKRIYDVLKETEALENTYMIYTSDHGYHLGQFGLIKGKSFPFEFDVRIPFLVRGPGIEPGSMVPEIALNIDLAPTILDIAQVKIPSHMDGRSLLKLVHKRKKNRKLMTNWPDTFLIESSGRRDATTASNPEVYLSSKILSVTTDVDGNSMTKFSTENVNAIDDTNSARLSFTSEPEEFPTLPAIVPSKAERLAIECQQRDYSFPCNIGQKWYCVLTENRWRKHKCRFPPRKISRSSNLQKCTCITEDGIVYMKFQNVDELGDTDSNSYSLKDEPVHPAIVHYLKSNKSTEELINELAKTWKTMKRDRRYSSIAAATIESTSSDSGGAAADYKLDSSRTFDVIDGQMFELPTPNNYTNDTTCMVLFDGSVRCSPEIYNDPVLLKMSQEKIGEQIKKMQFEIKKLRSIQRHLQRKSSRLTNTIGNGGVEFRKYNFSDSSSLKYFNRNESNSKKNTIPHRRRHQHSNDDPIGIRQWYPLADDFESGFNDRERQFAESSVPDTCFCIHHVEDESSKITVDLLRKEKKRLKEIRQKKKERKMKKKAKVDRMCFQEKMNCFSHDNNHWRTPPYWTEGSFCFCMNANNNTYNCLRTINETHNFLYCEFVTGLTTFYNVKNDPYQLSNQFDTLTTSEKSWLKVTLSLMTRCKGSVECGYRSSVSQTSNLDSLPRYQKKMATSDRKGRRRNMAM